MNAKKPTPFPAMPENIPYSAEAEQGLLGSVMTAPDVFYAVDYLQAEDFYILRHGYIWEAITRIIERRATVDFVSVQEELRQAGRLEDIGGAAYLLQLVNMSVNWTHAPTYAELVNRAAVRRRLLVASDAIRGFALDEKYPIEQVAAASEVAIIKAVGNGAGAKLRSVGEIAGKVLESAENVRFEGKPRIYAAPSPKLDKYNLFAPKRYGIIAGRPGMGKTWMLLWVALHYARLGHPVFFFTVEMSEEDLTQRLLCMIAGVQSQKFDTGTATSAEWERFTDAIVESERLPLYIEAPASGQPLTPASMRGRVRRGLSQVKPDKMPIIILDYIQHERVSGGERFEKQTNRARELSYISGSLVGLAQDTGAHVVVAAQLNRELLGRNNKRPRKEDLKESGTLEQDAWWIGLLHSIDYYNNPQAYRIGLELIIDKNRGGMTDTEHFNFDKSIGQLE